MRTASAARASRRPRSSSARRADWSRTWLSSRPISAAKIARAFSAACASASRAAMASAAFLGQIGAIRLQRLDGARLEFCDLGAGGGELAPFRLILRHGQSQRPSCPLDGARRVPHLLVENG
jgi:hypothetical protein